MDRWILLLALTLSAVAAVQGAGYIYKGVRSRLTLPLMIASFIAQMAVLGMRSDLRGCCPLGDLGEILIFSAWSLTIFYVAVGSMFRLSLLGVFTAPLVTFLLAVATLPGMLDISPERVVEIDPWGESHAALSVLAYGALGLSAVAGVMFIVLNRQLKDAAFTTGLFKNLPPARELSSLVKRLLVIGFILLTSGLACGLMMEVEAGYGKHFVIAIGQWIAYGIFLLTILLRGMPPGKLSLISVILFVLSLLIFPLLS